MAESNEATMDDSDLTLDYLDDGEFEDESSDDGLIRSKPKGCDLRRKIEERLERRRLCEELGLADDELEL